MNKRSRRRLTDLALLVTLTGAWITHEAGMLLHSLVSLVFTAVLIAHARNNWKVFRSLLGRGGRDGAIDGFITAAMATVVATGLVFWATTGDQRLGHEPIAIVATVALLGHFWSHRRSLAGLIRRSTAVSTCA